MSNINKQENSYKVSVQQRNLISLPKEIREKLKINIGDILDIRIEGNKIIIEPYKLVPSSQAYFWSEGTQKDLLEAQHDVENGRVREFNDVNDFLEGLKND